LIHIICGAVLLIVAMIEDASLANSSYIMIPKYGISVHDLTFMVCVPAILLGLISLIAVKYWASLVTNRVLLGNLIRSYMASCVILFICTLWCTCVLFLTFEKVKSWKSTIELASIFPCFISTAVFILPYGFSIFIYTFEISYLLEEMDLGGNIDEPEPPDDAMDLTDVTMLQSLLFFIATPFILCIQLYDLLLALQRHFRKYLDRRQRLYEKRELKRGKQRTACEKITKTFSRCLKTCRRCWYLTPKEIVPDAYEENDITQTKRKAAQLERDREEKEKQERMRIEKEHDRKKAEVEAERRKRLEEKEMLVREEEHERAEQARLVLEEEERQEVLRKQKEDEVNARLARVLTVHKFKELWPTLATGGSFQCKLKSLPSILNFTDHMKNQGFHVVFAATPSPTELEVGICNIRPTGTETWFMTRFLASGSNFSAVMKSQNPDDITQYVKKFSLAKVLKIDTSKDSST